MTKQEIQESKKRLAEFVTINDYNFCEECGEMDVNGERIVHKQTCKVEEARAALDLLEELANE